jgi:hypothetical protein
MRVIAKTLGDDPVLFAKICAILSSIAFAVTEELWLGMAAPTEMTVKTFRRSDWLRIPATYSPVRQVRS